MRYLIFREECVTMAGLSLPKTPAELEKHLYTNAKTKQEYLSNAGKFIVSVESRSTKIC